MELVVEKNLTWGNQSSIDIMKNTITVSLTKTEVEVLCDFDYGYAGRGTERIYFSLELLEELIQQIKNC